ncbi:MAG: reverse transcriptase family protein, partial [Cytophagales bacterium]|nr:reverse transcriptase family protein [Cytophagales bacterium]
NDYFSSIASNVKKQIRTRETFDPGGFQEFLHDSCPRSIYIKPVESGEVYKIVNNLKNKATLDTKILPLKLANCSFKFTEVLAKIVNTSLKQGIFPQSLKVARVIPVHKEGSKTDVTNYRPISLLSSFSKIYEKLMHSRVIEFLDGNDSLFENQYGFRPGRSCEHALLNAQNSILHALSRKEIALLLLIDFSKAFDVIEHPILLKKLEHYG